MTMIAATLWDQSPEDYLRAFRDFYDAGGRVNGSEMEVLRGLVHALRMHEDEQAQAFAHYGYFAGRFDHLGDTSTPPLYVPDEVWAAAQKSLSDYPKRAPVHPVALAMHFMMTEYLFELDAVGDFTERHTAIARGFAYPAIGRDTVNEPLDGPADEARFKELFHAFMAGTATWTSQRWYERAVGTGGEVAANSQWFVDSDSGSARYRNIALHQGQIESKDASSRILLDGQAARVVECRSAGRIRAKSLPVLPDDHRQVLEKLSFDLVVQPDGSMWGTNESPA